MSWLQGLVPLELHGWEGWFDLCAPLEQKVARNRG